MSDTSAGREMAHFTPLPAEAATPFEAELAVDTIVVRLRADSNTDVREIVLSPPPGYFANPAGTDQISLLTAGQSREVAFFVSPEVDPVTIPALSLRTTDLVSVTWNRERTHQRSLLGVIGFGAIGLVVIGVGLSIWRKEPLTA